MPVRLFTDAERERLSRFPRDVSPADLLAFSTKSDDELQLIGDRRGDHNRLGFGLQLKTLPYLGFVPDDLGSAPARVVAYLALQLSVSSDALQRYGDPEHTRTDHLQEIQGRLGFRDADQHHLAALGGWLLDRALEHDRPIVLFHVITAASALPAVAGTYSSPPNHTPRHGGHRARTSTSRPRVAAHHQRRDGSPRTIPPRSIQAAFDNCIVDFAAGVRWTRPFRSSGEDNLRTLAAAVAAYESAATGNTVAPESV